MTAQPYQTYLRNAVLTAGPAQLTALLFDGVLRRLATAQRALQAGDAAAANAALCRAQEMIAYLQESLDEGHPLSASLDALYRFCWRRLLEANAAKDAAAVQEVCGLLQELRDAWRQAAAAAGGQSHAG